MVSPTGSKSTFSHTTLLRPMNDSDGPLIAKMLYSKLFQQPTAYAPRHVTGEEFKHIFENALTSVRSIKESELDALKKWIRHDLYALIRDIGCRLTDKTFRIVARKAFMHISPGPVLDSEVEAVEDAFVWGIMTPSLANLVDEIVQELRVSRKLPASRWATFVNDGA